jgi:hypothetical protein
LVAVNAKGVRKILAADADSCRESAARAVKTSQSDPQRRTVVFEESERREHAMKQTRQRVAATDRKYESRVVSEYRIWCGRRGDEGKRLPWQSHR